MPQPKPVADPQAKPGIPQQTPAVLGERATAFIDTINADTAREKFYPPLTLEKFSALAQLLATIDLDFTKSMYWKNYWSQPLIEHGMDPVLI